MLQKSNAGLCHANVTPLALQLGHEMSLFLLARPALLLFNELVLALFLHFQT